MKKLILSVFVVLLIFSEVDAQRRNGLIRRRVDNSGSVILSLGPSFAFTDTKGFPLNYWDQGNISLGFRYKFPGVWGVKGNFGVYRFSGSDGGYVRNYDFTSTMYQFTTQAEYSYTFGRRYGRAKPSTVYGFVGTGVIYVESNLSRNGGANGSYTYRPAVVAPVIPYGAGYQYDFDPSFFIGAEINFGYLFTDYLDGFMPPRPSSSSNDVYEGISVTFGYRIW